MNGRKLLLTVALMATAGVAALPGSASAAPAPGWTISSLPSPTNFTPGDEAAEYVYEVFATNNGGKTTEGSDIVLTDTLPSGLGVKDVELYIRAGSKDLGPAACKTTVVGEVSTVTCTLTESIVGEKEPARIGPSEALRLAVHVSIPSTQTGVLRNEVAVSGGDAPLVDSAVSINHASPNPAAPGFTLLSAEMTAEDGELLTQAAAHPYQYTTSYGVNTSAAPPGSLAPLIAAGGDLKEIEVKLPPGIAGNPTSVPKCTAQDFNTPRAIGVEGVNIFANLCPNASAVGLVVVQQLEGIGASSAGGLGPALVPVPLYNLVPPKGMPAQFGFQVAGAPIYINTKLRTGGDYGVTAFVKHTSVAKRVTAATITIWGTPAASSHDTLRGTCLSTSGFFSVGSCEAKLETIEPFFRLPTSCASPLLTTMSFDRWTQPGLFTSESASTPAATGCNLPEFKPTIEVQPTTNSADSTSGLHVDLRIPQNQDPNGLGEADLRNVSVTLPSGLLVNPSSANGLAGCSAAQVDLHGEGPANCPDASKIGTVEIETPLLDHPLPGAVYLAKQGENPFNSLIAIYIAVNDPESGVVVKLAGKVSPDPATGQLTSTFLDNPQQPIEAFHLDFFEGARASLRTPAKCGGYTTTTSMTPWTAPESGPDATPADRFEIVNGPGGGCPSGALAPKLDAGLQSPTAGTYSPFSLRLRRDDATQEIAGISASTPTGLTAKLKGIPYCPEAGIAQAASRSHPGDGAAEASSSSCPDASQLGTTTTGAGAGPSPFYASGKVYLAGPYKGAPISLVAIVPALAGPFDLGVVTNRIALRVDPETTQVTADADPLPTILAGIPLDIRDLRVDLDRPGFTLAPTSCEPKSVTANVLGTGGSTATISDRFQVGGCDALRFKPSLSLKLKGGTKRSAHPALRAVVTYPQGSNYANTAKASVALPHSEFLEQAHIRTICTRVQFAAKACPKGSIYGKARAFTPLLDQPLEGPVYLRSSSNPLPDLVLALSGQIDAYAVARIDSHNGGIRTSFESVPDAPLSKVVLEMQGGKKGLLVNSRNICKHTNRATAKFRGQNGKTYNFRPVLKDSCASKKQKKKKQKKHTRRSHK